MTILSVVIAQAQQLAGVVQIDMLILWVLVVLLTVLSIITAFFVIRIQIMTGQPMTEHEQNILYFLVKKALFKAVKEYDEGLKEPIDESPVPEVKEKTDKVKSKNKESKVKVSTSKGGFGDLSTHKRKPPRKR